MNYIRERIELFKRKTPTLTRILLLLIILFDVYLAGLIYKPENVKAMTKSLTNRIYTIYTGITTISRIETGINPSIKPILVATPVPLTTIAPRAKSTSTPTPSSTPTPTLIITPSLIPSPTPTESPIATYSATPSPLSSPSATPSTGSIVQ